MATMSTINKILFPVDFSNGCRSVARYVEAFAGQFEAEILLLHVVGPGEGELTLPEELLPGRQAQLNAFLANELKYFATERVCVIGDDPAAEIVATARRRHADLVMMPTRGLGVFERFMLGSVAAKVLHDLECPVWTSVHSDAVLPLEDIHCRRILCALDLTDRSRYVLDSAAALAAVFEADFAIVHAAAKMAATVMAVSLGEELAHSIAEQASREIENLQETAGTKAPVFVRSGDPGKIVIDTARDFAADLLVIGRHESGNQDDWSIIRNSPCPVISI